MKKFNSIVLIFCILFSVIVGFGQKASYPEIKTLHGPQNPRLAFMIHGGAGVIKKGSLSPEKEKEYTAKLEEALLAGYKVLQQGGSSLDAVETAIKILEDSPLFNAGKGAVFTNDGKNELDSSIMDGKTLKAGAVAGVKTVKNPITAARAVMEKSEHVMLSGDGADRFAKDHGLTIVEPKYFWTQERWDSLQNIIKKEKATQEIKEEKISQDAETKKPEGRFGTVGAVALDKNGNLAAGTSTGGMTNKRFGRIGDAPIIGAGTFANNDTCAVSATGWGEYFIRLGVARDISSLMEYRAMQVQNAADMVIKQKLQKLGGDGGVIAVDKFGNMAISFNSEGMYRAYINAEGKPVVEIYEASSK